MEGRKGFDSKNVTINRDVVYSKQVFDSAYKDRNPSKTFISKIAYAARKKISCSYVKSFFPVLTWISAYKLKTDLKADILSGLTVACVNVPQALASSLILGVRAQYGFYTSCFQPVIYFILGGSPHLSIGTFLTLSMMCSSTVGKHSVQVVDAVNETLNGTQVMMERDGLTPEDVAVSLALALGLWLILFSIIGLGNITAVLSEQFMQAFVNSISTTLFLSQLKGVLGLNIPKNYGPFGTIENVVLLLTNLPNTNLVTLALSAAAFILYYVGNKLLNDKYKDKIKFYIPIELILVIISTVVCHFGNLHEDHSVVVIGSIPQGFTAPRVPQLTLIPDILLDSLLVAILMFASMHCYSEFFSKNHGTPKVAPNQELLAFGVMNAVCSFLSCYPGGAAFSRSNVQSSSGGKTQIATMVSSAMLLLVIAFLGPSIYSLPKCVLSVIIITSSIKTAFNVTAVKQLWKSSKPDLFVFLFVYFTSVLINANFGMILGISVSLLVLIFRLFKTNADELQPLDDTEIYLKKSLTNQNVKVKIVRFNGSINFISRERFQSIMEKRIDQISAPLQSNDVSISEVNHAPMVVKLQENGDCKTSLSSIDEKKSLDDFIPNKNGDLIASFASVAFIDFSGLATLKEVAAFAERKHVNLYICCCSASVYRFLNKSDFFSNFSEDRMFASVHDAVCMISN